MRREHAGFNCRKNHNYNARTNAVCKQLPFAALLQSITYSSQQPWKGISNHENRKKVAEATFATCYA